MVTTRRDRGEAAAQCLALCQLQPFLPAALGRSVPDAFSHQPEFGARELRRLIKTDIENLLARKLLAGELKEGDRVTVNYSANDGVTIDQVKSRK